jgi:hypothetical protein
MPRRSRPKPASRSDVRGRTLPKLAVLSALCALSVPALALAAETPSGGTIGRFSFSGQLRGALKVPKRWNLGATQTQAGCEKTVDKTSFNIFLYNVKLALNGHKTALNGGSQSVPVLLNVQVGRYGQKESFANQATSGGVPDFPASINLNAYAGRRVYSWESNAGSSTMSSAGTVTTNASGTGGSLSATLVPTGTGLPTGVSGHATGLLHVKGSWSDCVRFKG